MVALTELKDPLASFDPTLVVYVEGETDQRLLETRLLRKYDAERRFKLSIKVPQGGTGQSEGGCTAVLRQVEESEDGNGKVVFGLVDRDVTLRDGDLDVFLEVDDGEFRRKCRGIFGERIHCLARWEIENYLLCDPELLEVELANPPTDKPKSRVRSSDEVVRELLKHAELLFPLIAVNVELHRRGIKKLPQGFGKDVDDHEAMKRELRLCKGVKDGLIDVEDVEAKLVPRLKAFAEGAMDGSLERWVKLSRIVDGKMLVARLFASRAAESALARIAQHLGRRLQIDQEIVDAIESFYEVMKRVLKGGESTAQAKAV